MAYKSVSETFQPFNSGGYDSDGNYYSSSSDYVTNSIFLDEDNFEAFDASAINSYISSLASVSSVTLNSSLYNSDGLQNQAVGVVPLYYNNIGYQDTVLSDMGSDGAGDKNGAYNFQDLQDQAGAQVGTVTNLSLNAGSNYTHVNVYSIVQEAAAASRALIVAYVNNAANYGLTNVSSASITVTGLIPYDLPIITGTQANQVVALGSTFEPFSTVSISDPGNPSGAGDSAAIQIQMPFPGAPPTNTDFQGTLGFEGGYKPFGAFQSYGDGDYELSDETSISGLQSDLRHLAFTPTYGGSAVELDLQVQSAAGGETDDDNTSFLIVGQQPCFAAGTCLETPDGYVAVDRLTIGDIVHTTNGDARIRWVGHRRVTKAVVVRFRPHALGPGSPRRDLWVSDDHAMLVDGYLVPARLLVNGSSVVEERRDIVTFYHVELEQHSILFAEGAPAESYLDTGNRAKFANCPLSYNSSKSNQDPCANLIVSGNLLETVRASIRIPLLKENA